MTSAPCDEPISTNFVDGQRAVSAWTSWSSLSTPSKTLTRNSR